MVKDQQVDLMVFAECCGLLQPPFADHRSCFKSCALLGHLCHNFSPRGRRKLLQLGERDLQVKFPGVCGDQNHPLWFIFCCFDHAELHFRGGFFTPQSFELLPDGLLLAYHICPGKTPLGFLPNSLH